ncbi:ComF family protein [Bacillus cereus]|uniref:ComF family protein n=1 Tax=Bacillus cereus TaxID=1396 RepID=UPI003D660CA5
MHCLLCDECFVEKVSWYTFFVKCHRKYICDRCEQKLSYIIGEICMECGRPLEFVPASFQEDGICIDCIRWMNEEKYRPFRSLFQKYFADVSTVIAVPLSKEREVERGFNQAELLATCLPVRISDFSLRRRETEKQSKKTRKERMSGSNPFYFQGEEMFCGQHILLVDDVYTTGITVRQIGSLLYERGAREVSSLTLCRS